MSDNHGSEDVPDQDSRAVCLKNEDGNATKPKDDEKDHSVQSHQKAVYVTCARQSGIPN